MADDRQGGIESLVGGPRNAIIVLIGVILVAGVGIGAIVFEVFGRNRVESPTTAQPSGPAAVPSDAAPQQEPACSEPPGIEATSWEMTRDGLAIGADLSATCEDGNTLSGSAATVTISMGTRDIASGVFDLSAEPIVISPGGRESRTLIFPAGMYWRPPELINDTVTTTITDSGSAADSDSVANGSSTLTAVKGAAPGHGSTDGTAGNALRELSAADSPHVNGALENLWVPQISSKRVGLVAEGITWGNADILRNHLTLRQRYDDVRLVKSGQWSTFSSPDFWVTVVGQPSVDAAIANRWCDSHGIDADNCFAKWISNTIGPEGTTVMRK